MPSHTPSTCRRRPECRRTWRRTFTAAILLVAGRCALAAAEPEPPVPWWTVRSESFVLHTDATPERGAEVALHLELFRRAFGRLAPEIELQNPAPTKIIAFRDRRAYDPYKPVPDGGGSMILGAFLRHPDGNFLTLDAGSRLAGAFAVVYHEFVHYLVDHNFPAAPRWFHEGLAEYYSTFVVDGDTAILGRPVERHLRWLRTDNARREAFSLSHDFSLAEVLTGEAAHHRSRAPGFYAFSWALVHHLLSGAPEQLDRAADFLAQIRDGEDPETAFHRAFDHRLEEMEETLRGYGDAPLPGALASPGPSESAERFPISGFRVEELGRPATAAAEPLPPASALVHLGDLLSRMGRLETAEGHFRKALELDPAHPEAHAGLALVRDHQGRFAEAELHYRDALRLGSQDPLTYLRYGRHLLARLAPPVAGIEVVRTGELTAIGELVSTSELVTPSGLRDAAELAAARRAFRRAVELDGDFAQAQRLFGVAHLFGDVDPTPGIRAVAKVHRWLPADDRVAFDLLQLHLKRGDFARAEGLFRERFRDHRDLELARRAGEEIDRARLLHGASAALAEGRPEEALRLFDEAIAVCSDQRRRDRMSEALIALEERLRRSPQPQPPGSSQPP